MFLNQNETSHSFSSFISIPVVFVCCSYGAASAPWKAPFATLVLFTVTTIAGQVQLPRQALRDGGEIQGEEEGNEDDNNCSAPHTVTQHARISS